MEGRIEGLDHVQLALPAGREPQARAFYGGLLGLVEEPKPPALAGRGGCWFRAGAVGLHLGVEEDFRPAQKAHPAFLVRGLGALVARLERAGVALAPGGPPEGGPRRVHLRDPFGNRLELVEQRD